MKNYIIGFLLIGILANVGFVFGDDGVSISPEWKYKTGGSIGSVSITPDGNVVAGSCGAIGEGDGCVYYFDKNGNLLWKYKIGDGVGVSITPDGEYVVAESHGNVYFFDKNGNLLWKYKTGDCAISVSITPDGEYVVAGSHNGNVYFFDKNGNLLW